MGPTWRVCVCEDSELGSVETRVEEEGVADLVTHRQVSCVSFLHFVRTTQGKR